jgi:hypothetical protein
VDCNLNIYVDLFVIYYKNVATDHEIISCVFLAVDGVHCLFKYLEHMMKFGSYQRSTRILSY